MGWVFVLLGLRPVTARVAVEIKAETRPMVVIYFSQVLIVLMYL